MNKVYKVVWNSALQCYTVVSEIAKSHTKSSSKKVVGATLLASLISLPVCANAEDVNRVYTTDDINWNEDVNLSYSYLTLDNQNVVALKDVNIKEGGSILGSSIDSSLHVKGDMNIINKATPTSTEDYLKVQSLASICNAKIDGNLNVISDNIHEYITNYEGVDYKNKSYLSSFYTKDLSVGKDLTLEKSSFSLSSEIKEDSLNRFTPPTISEEDKNDPEKYAEYVKEYNEAYSNFMNSLTKDDFELGNAAIEGNLTQTDGAKTYVEKYSSIKVGGDFSSDNSEVVVTDNSTLTVDGNMTVSQDVDENVWNKAENGSSITVNGDLNVKGLYKEGDYNATTGAEGNAYHRLMLFATGEGSSINVKGDTYVSDNVQLFTESYSNSLDNPDHDKYISKDNFKSIATSTYEGNVNVSRNSAFGAYNAGDVSVKGNVTAQLGGQIGAWDSDSTMDIAGNVKVSDKGSEIGVGRTGKIRVVGDLSLNNEARTHIESNASLKVGGNYSSENGEVVVTDNSTLTVDGDMTVSQDVDENVWNKAENGSSITVNGDLNVKGLYKEGDYNATTGAEGNAYHRLMLFATGEGSSINVKGDTYVSDNVQLFTESYSNSLDNPDHDKYISKDNFKSIATSTYEGNVNVSRNSAFGAYNAGDVSVKGNVTAQLGGQIGAWDSDSTMDIAGNVKVSDKGSEIGVGRTGKIRVVGDLSLNNEARTHIESNASLKVGGNYSSENGEVVVTDNSTLTVDGDMTVSQDVDENVWNKAENGSSITVNGDLNVKGLYKEGDYNATTGAEGNAYHRLMLFATGEGSSINVKGDTYVSDNVQLFTESYSNSLDNPDHDKYISKDNFKSIATSTYEGNVNVSRNGKFGSFNAGDTVVKGNVTAVSGGDIDVWDSDSTMDIAGNVKVSDKGSKISVGRTGKINIAGNLNVSDGASSLIGKDSVLTVGKTFSVKDATLNIENGKLLLSGENAVLDLTSNGVLKTNTAGSVKIEKGAQVKSKTATLVSEDKTTTAEGVAEKTFDADALSKVSLVDFGETTLDEAKKLHSILFTSDTGILDVAIKDKPSADDKGNVSFDDAISAGGTSAVEDKTVAGVDTSDKTLSDLTPSDSSWGSASLKEGQNNLNLGSANLALNNAENNGGSFVSTADGKAGSVTMDNGANLGLNGSGNIGGIVASDNGAGNVLVGTDKTGSVTADNVGSEKAAVGSVSVGSGSELTVSNALYALKATFDKASSLISQILETPELKAVGDNISIKADRSVLGGLISGKNTSLESKFLSLKEDLKLLGGAALNTENLALSGKTLFVDPAWNEDASVVTADRLSGANGDTLDGAMTAGQNSLIAVCSSMDINTAKAYAARNLSETGTGAIVYLGKSINVADNGSIRVDGSLTSLPVTAANTVVIENNGRLVLDNDASVGFEAANGTVVNNGTVAVKKDSLSNGQKIAAFTGENVTVSGTGTYDLGSALFSAQNNGNGTLTVDYDEAKATSALQGTDYTVAQSVKSAVQSGLAVRNGTILGDLVNSGNSASTADTLNQLTRIGALSGSVANAKLASDSTVRAIDSRLKTSGVKTSSQAKVDGSRVSVWVQPVFSRQSSSSLDAGISQYGLKTTLRGGVAGLDAAFADNWTLGAALSVGNGSSSSKNIKNVSGDFDYYGVSLYGAYVNDALRVSSDIGYTKVSNDATAYNSLGKFTADIDTSVLTAGIRGGYTFSTSFADITPHAGIRYTSYDVDDYSAVSGLYRMDNEGGSSSLVSFPVGVSFSKSIAAGNWTVVPAVDLEVIPVAGDKDKDTRSVFDGVLTSVNTKLHDGINYSTYVGLDAMYGDSLSLGISYNYTGSDNIDDHSFNAGVRYTF